MLNLLEKPRVDLGTALDPAAEPEHEWVGVMSDIGREEPRYDLGLRLRLRLCAGLIDGRGVGWLDGGTGPTIPISVTGALSEGAARFELWIDLEELANVQILCDGALSLKEDRIEGSWRMPCLDPEGCGCGGFEGPIHLDKQALE